MRSSVLYQLPLDEELTGENGSYSERGTGRRRWKHCLTWQVACHAFHNLILNISQVNVKKEKFTMLQAFNSSKYLNFNIKDEFCCILNKIFKEFRINRFGYVLPEVSLNKIIPRIQSSLFLTIQARVLLKVGLMQIVLL